MVVKCTSTGQLTGSRTIGELLLLKQTSQTKMFAGQPFNPQNFSEVSSLGLTCISFNTICDQEKMFGGMGYAAIPYNESNNDFCLAIFWVLMYWSGNSEGLAC